jgi:hypothetical protein
MPPPPPQRRPVNVTALEEHATRRKLRAGVVLPEAKRKTLSLARESFVPLLQADVGTSVPISFYRGGRIVPDTGLLADPPPATPRPLQMPAQSPDVRNRMTTRKKRCSGWRVETSFGDYQGETGQDFREPRSRR